MKRLAPSPFLTHVMTTDGRRIPREQQPTRYQQVARPSPHRLARAAAAALLTTRREPTEPMGWAHREAVYHAQNGNLRLTARQRRRMRKKNWEYF